MAILFLSGGGDLAQSKDFDVCFLQQLKGKKIGYVPWAFPQSRYKDCMQWIAGLFPVYEGFEVELLDEQCNYREESLLLKTLDAIYIGGGNTYRLMKICRENGFLEFLKVFIDGGKPVYGGSAGAIILGKSMHSSPDANITNLDNELAKGLNYVHDCSLFCHYKGKEDWEIQTYVEEHQHAVLALPEGSGVIIDGEQIIVAGGKVAYFQQQKEKLEFIPGETIKR